MWMATLKDVARAAGVSLTTASYALNGKGAISEVDAPACPGDGEAAWLPQAVEVGTGAIVAIVAYPGVGASARCARRPRNTAMSSRSSRASRNSSEAPDLVATFGKVAGVVVHGGLWRREFLRAVAEAIHRTAWRIAPHRPVGHHLDRQRRQRLQHRQLPVFAGSQAIWFGQRPGRLPGELG